MAGSKIQRERFKLLDDMGYDAVLKAYLEVGSVQKLVERLFTVHPDWADKEGSKPSRINFYQWLERRELLERFRTESKKLRAEQLIEESEELTDTVTEDNVRSQGFKARHKLDIAKALDPRYSGKTVEVNATVQVGVREAEVLQGLDDLVKEMRAAQAYAQSMIPVVEAEVLEEEEGGEG